MSDLIERLRASIQPGDYKTTEIYAHLAPEGAQGAVDKLQF